MQVAIVMVLPVRLVVRPIEHELLAHYTPDGYTIMLKQLIEAHKPTYVIFPHTYQVRDFAPKLATALNRVLVSDVIGHRIDNGALVLVRQLFQGKFNADVRFEGEPPSVVALLGIVLSSARFRLSKRQTRAAGSSASFQGFCSVM